MGKRLLFLLCAMPALLLSSREATAQEGRSRMFGFLDELTVGFGGAPAGFVFEDGSNTDEYYYGSYSYLNTDLSGLYTPTVKNSVYSPVLFLETGTYLTSWLRLGLHLGYYHNRGESFLPISGDVTRSYSYKNFFILPQAKFIWLDSSLGYYLYSGVDVGCKLVRGHDGEDKISKVGFAGDLIPFGLSIMGKKAVSISFESVFGSEVMGGRLSISYRF